MLTYLTLHLLAMNPNRSFDTPDLFPIGGNEAFGHFARFCPYPAFGYASMFRYAFG